MADTGLRVEEALSDGDSNTIEMAKEWVTITGRHYFHFQSRISVAQVVDIAASHSSHSMGEQELTFLLFDFFGLYSQLSEAKHPVLFAMLKAHYGCQEGGSKVLWVVVSKTSHFWERHAQRWAKN